MNDHIYELQTLGVTLIPAALSSPRVEALSRVVTQLLAEDDVAWGREALEAIGQRGALRNLCDLNPVFADLLSMSPIYPVLDAVLGENYLLHSYDSLTLFGADGRFPWDFHTDVSALNGVGFPARATPGINCLYSLSDTTADNGATWVVPASHHSLTRNPPVDLLAKLGVQFESRAGDALLFDARIWHCAGNNRTGQERTVIKAFFVAPWQQPQMDYSRAVRPEILARLDERTRRLLGVGSAPPASVSVLRHELARRKNTG